MNLRLGSAALALALLTPLLAAVPASAGEGTATLRFAQADRKDDVHVERPARGKLSKQVLRALDVTSVRYVVDRTDEILTVTFRMRHGAVPAQPYRFYYATIAMQNPQDYTAPSVVLLSRPGSTAVHVLDLYADDAGRRCAHGSSAATKGGRAVTMTVPFACLGDVEHARLWSGVGLEHRGGGDVAWDTAPRTSKVLLTAVVPPAED